METEQVSVAAIGWTRRDDLDTRHHQVWMDDRGLMQFYPHGPAPTIIRPVPGAGTLRRSVPGAG
jgi:hypothetical protein